MSNSISTLRICRQAAVLVILTLAGCDLEDSPLQPVAVDDATDLPALAPPAGALTGTADDDWPGESMFRQMVAVEPSFAGYFFEGDEGNELVVLATTGAVGSTGVGGGGGGPGDLVPDLLSGTLPFDVSSVSVRTAEYSFLQLSEWRELIEPTIWASDDITGLDLDEQTNQLIVLLDTGRGEEEIRAAARLLGVPDAALGFEVSAEPVATDLTLRNAVRPARGGTQIQYLKSNGEILNCTYGFNAVMGSDTVMVTNSRCTPTTFGAPLNGRVWQADYDVDTPPIGTEFIDPPDYGCGYVFWECRKSDPAAYLLGIPSADIGPYQIARTTSRSHGENGSGSLIMSPNRPYFNITTEISHPSKGTYLNKIGRTVTTQVPLLMWR